MAGALTLPLAAGGVAEREPEARETSAAAPEDAGVARSAFTTGVVEREPRDAITRLENDARSVSYFTELRGLEGQTVVHRWEFGGEVRAEVSFAVGGPRWRVHSTKRLDPAQLGEWSVAVIDGSGRVLARESFRYVAAGASDPESE